MTTDDRWGFEMSAVAKEDFRSLLYLVSLGVVGAATVGVFFGIGFLLLRPPDPATPPADPVPPAQASEALETARSGSNDTAWGSSPAASADKVVASRTPGAPSDRETRVLESPAIETTLIPPAGITHGKGVGIGRHRHRRTWRHWTASWRPDARAGPNPGGGFYVPPNINVGYINPR
jgi:hypothetical protein